MELPQFSLHLAPSEVEMEMDASGTRLDDELATNTVIHGTSLILVGSKPLLSRRDGSKISRFRPTLVVPKICANGLCLVTVVRAVE